MTSVEIAAGCGDLVELKRLLAGDVYPSAKDGALCAAAREGQLAIVEYLIGIAADVHSRDDLPLFEAARNGHVAVIDRLLSAGVDARMADDDALLWAVAGGHIKAVRRLLSEGCDPRSNELQALVAGSGYERAGPGSRSGKSGGD